SMPVYCLSPLYRTLAYSSSYLRGRLSFPTRRSSDLRTRLVRCTTYSEVANSAPPPKAKITRLVWIGRIRPKLIQGRSKFSCGQRSEEPSELQSRENLVCRLLLEKKKKKNYHIDHQSN